MSTPTTRAPRRARLRAPDRAPATSRTRPPTIAGGTRSPTPSAISPFPSPTQEGYHSAIWSYRAFGRHEPLLALRRSTYAAASDHRGGTPAGPPSRGSGVGGADVRDHVHRPVRRVRRCIRRQVVERDRKHEINVKRPRRRALASSIQSMGIPRGVDGVGAVPTGAGNCTTSGAVAPSRRWWSAPRRPNPAGSSPARDHRRHDATAATSPTGECPHVDRPPRRPRRAHRAPAGITPRR